MSASFLVLLAEVLASGTPHTLSEVLVRAPKAGADVRALLLDAIRIAAATGMASMLTDPGAISDHRWLQKLIFHVHPDKNAAGCQHKGNELLPRVYDAYKAVRKAPMSSC